MIAPKFTDLLDTYLFARVAMQEASRPGYNMSPTEYTYYTTSVQSAKNALNAYVAGLEEALEMNEKYPGGRIRKVIVEAAREYAKRMKQETKE